MSHKPVKRKWTSPSSIGSSPQNDFDPGPGDSFRLTSSLNVNISGIVAGDDGEEFTLMNIGANTLTFENQGAGSSAANRIITGTGADIDLDPDESINLKYDTTASRWRAVSASLDVADLSITTAKLANTAVTLAKLGNSSVSSVKIVGSAVIASKLPLLTRQRIPGLNAVTAEAEGTPGADDIRFTIEAIDHNNAALTARAIIDIWVSTGAFLAPAGTHTITVDTGVLIGPATIGNTEAFRVQSDTGGVVKIIVNVTGAGTRALMASVNGSQVQFKVATWT